MKKYLVKINYGKLTKEYKAVLYVETKILWWKFWEPVTTMRGPAHRICKIALDWSTDLKCEVIDFTAEDTI